MFFSLSLSHLSKARLMHVSSASSAWKTQGSGKTRRTRASLHLSLFPRFFFSRHARRKVFWGPQCALASANSNFPHEMFASEVQTKIHCFSVYHYAEMLMTA